MTVNNSAPRSDAMAPRAPARVIAEVGCNHKGDFEIAREMIGIAAHFCKVDAIKFQKRNPRELLTEKEYNAPHPNPMHSYGATYGEHREKLELDIEKHALLKAECEKLGVTYACSVWDLTSAREIASLRPSFIKIPSASNMNVPVLEWLCTHYAGELHISLGMTTPEETERVVGFFAERSRLDSLVLYACTSGYPVPFEDVCLLEISKLRERYEGRVRAIGFSGHHLGIGIDIAAYTLGAEWIERHFTLDRTWKGTDHAASLEPDGIRRMKRDLNAVQLALRPKHDGLLPIEIEQRRKLKTHVNL